MPITLKLSRPARPAEGNPNQAVPNLVSSSPPRRTVSFSQHHHQPSSPLAAAAIPYKGDPPGHDSSLGSTSRKLHNQGPPAPTPTTRPPRSPTPPSSEYRLCLPHRPTGSNLRCDATALSQTLTRLITRYATFAGYSDIEPSALDFLQEAVRVYIDSVLLLAVESALLGGRVDVTTRDLLPGLSWREHEEDERAHDALHQGSQPLPRLARYVSRLITWRHSIPDYYDEDPRPPEGDASIHPTWAQKDASSTIESDHPDDLLLARKTRYNEKSRRHEIPSHLPELPALHTWKETTNKPESEANSKTNLSRLETRLVSSRLAQGSLRSLIGRLESVSGRNPGSQQGLQGDDGIMTVKPDSTLASVEGTRSTAAVTPTTAKEGVSSLPSPSSPAVVNPRSSNRSLSVRLRPQSVSGLSSFASREQVTDVEASNKRRRGLSEYDHTLRLDFRGDASAAASPSSPLATPNSAMNTPLGFLGASHRRQGSLISPAISTSSLTFATAAGYPWSDPLMSPMTPMSASGAGSGRYFGTNAFAAAAQDATTTATPTSAKTFLSPSLSSGTAVGAGVGVGVGVEGEGRSDSTSNIPLPILPPIVNFKTGWYARKS